MRLRTKILLSLLLSLSILANVVLLIDDHGIKMPLINNIYFVKDTNMLPILYNKSNTIDENDALNIEIKENATDINYVACYIVPTGTGAIQDKTVLGVIIPNEENEYYGRFTQKDDIMLFIFDLAKLKDYKSGYIEIEVIYNSYYGIFHKERISFNIKN